MWLQRGHRIHFPGVLGQCEKGANGCTKYEREAVPEREKGVRGVANTALGRLFAINGTGSSTGKKEYAARQQERDVEGKRQDVVGSSARAR